MIVSDEEKRWIVVGIAMNKIAAPVWRDAIKQGMDTNYRNLDNHCQHLTPPCTLKTLTHGQVRADPILRNLKFQNINNNYLVHGTCMCNYNFRINSSTDLAKLYLPDYLAQFSAFDESLDLTAILRLLGHKKYMPTPLFCPFTQASADDVRENVRNKWGHVDVTEWTDALFNDCFDKLKTMVRSLGLTACVEKTTLDQMDDWQTKGCSLIMGHAVDKDLLCLVHDEVKDLIQVYNSIQSELNLQNTNAKLKEMDSCQETRLNEHQDRLGALEEKLQEAGKILQRLVSFKERLSVRLQAIEERVEQLEKKQTKTISDIEQLKGSHTRTAAKVEQNAERCTKAVDKVEQIELDLKGLKTQDYKTVPPSVFDFKSCRSKLEDHYRKTATVPTSVWCKKSVVDIHQIYTRLSWVKEEQTPTGTIQSELKHYSDLFTADKNGVTPKRILVQGQTGIGKSTFVKKLLVDWVEVDKNSVNEEAAVLKNFELVLAVNLKEVSKCERLTDVIRLSNVFAKEDKYMTEGLINYITNNQEKVLLIFDGYDEYRSGRSSEIYEIFRGNSLRSCCVLITTRISKADELRGGEDLHAEITGFSKVDREHFMRRFLSIDEALLLQDHLCKRNLKELAKVPLLLLFFCILWRKGRSKQFLKTKTKLYMNIIEFILNHSYSKQSPPQYVELTSLKEILSLIGKVALQALLKDDHLFEYSQLFDSIHCEESVLLGLLQVTEYSETLRPVGMVSFIHKSIQEFLAAWYVTYTCIPEGKNLGELGVKLEESLALENVFQFICGLSEDGALAILRHLKSVRMADPSLDLSKTVPDAESETDRSLSDVTERQGEFRDLVLNSFEEVESRAELSRACLNCLGDILLLSTTRSLPDDLLFTAKDTNSWSLVFEKTVCFWDLYHAAVSTLHEVVETIATAGAQILRVAEFLEKFQNTYCPCRCGFFSILSFRNGQVFFYITHLKLYCENHARLFTDNVIPSRPLHSSSGQLCLKFLKILECSPIGRSSMDDLGATFKLCSHCNLQCNICSVGNDSLCQLLEQVPNPSTCSLFIRRTSNRALRLALLLLRFKNVTHLDLCLAECSPVAATSQITRSQAQDS